MTDSIRRLPTERGSDAVRPTSLPRNTRRPRVARRRSVMAAVASTEGRLRIAAHVVSRPGGLTTGTFVGTGVVADSGTMGVLERYRALRADLELPAVVHAAESFSGASGAISIDYNGVFRPVAPGVFAGEGTWRVTGGNHAYERLGAAGTWAATATFGRDALTVDTVFEGTGALG